METRRNIKRKEIGAQGIQSEDSWRQNFASLQFENSVEVKSLSNEWLLYFSDLSVFTLIDSRFLLRPIRTSVTGMCHSLYSAFCYSVLCLFLLYMHTIEHL